MIIHPKSTIKVLAPAADCLPRDRMVGLFGCSKAFCTFLVAVISLACLQPLYGLMSGIRVGLVILVQFPDDPATPDADPINFPVSQEKMLRLCNEIGYADDGNLGSVRDYFANQSNGLLTVTHIATAIITVPHPKAFYSYSDYPANAILNDNGAAGNLLLVDCVSSLKNAGFDFSALSTDSNNRIVATSLLYAGASSGVWSKGLWPYSGSVPTSISVGSSGSHKYVLNYQMTNVPNASPGIGTVCHELCHMIMKFPDFYDTNPSNGESAGVGSHCLMGVGDKLGNDRAPAPIDLYLKDLCGWADLTDITPTTKLETALPTTGNIGYRIRNPGRLTEYYLIENRGSGDMWAVACPDNGIVIWHVDEAVATANQYQQMTPSNHYQLALIQADGHNDLENNTNTGDNTDLYDDTCGIINNNTTPNLNWWDGSPSGISISVLSPVGATMNIRFGAAPPTLSVAQPANNVAAEGLTCGFTVESNTAWSWTVNADWVTSNELGSQSGTRTLSYNVLPNLSVTGRTAVITVSVVGGLKATHTITQGGVFLADLVSYPGEWQNAGQWVAKPGSSLNIGCNVQNSGTAECSPYVVRFYLSADTTITTTDYCLGEVTMPSLGVGQSTSTGGVVVSIPVEIPAGSYYAGWIFDPDNQIHEVHDNNNSGCVLGATVMVDRTAPELTITLPATDGTTVTSSALLTVSGTAVDDATVKDVYLSTGGAWQIATGTNSWTGTVALVTGLNTIYILSYDTAGNKSQATRTVIYTPPASANPTITVSNPFGSNICVNNDWLDISGSATDDDRVSGVGYYLNGVWAWADGTTTWSMKVNLVTGKNEVTVYALDPSNNYTWKSLVVWYDATQPTVQVSTPGECLSVVKSPGLAISGTAGDNLILSGVYWRNNNGVWAMASGAETWCFTVPLALGQNIIEVKSKDLAGNYSVVMKRTVVLDASLPALTGIQAWRQTYFGNASNSGDGADTNDFDKDGIPNIIEYAFGLDPRQNSSWTLPVTKMQGGYMEISFIQPETVSGIVYEAEWSTTMSGIWTPVPDTGVGHKHVFSLPALSKTAVFMRIKTTAQ